MVFTLKARVRCKEEEKKGTTLCFDGFVLFQLLVMPHMSYLYNKVKLLKT